MPGTDWIGPTPNRRAGGMSEQRGLVLHIQDGTEAGSEAWFMNPESQASAHFLNPKSGNLRQMVDTDDRAWTQGAGNAYWISVENEGRGGDALTASQIENCAALLAWLHQTYGVPLQLTDDPNGRGLGWHGMGGSAWGGHYDCPGKPVLAQRGQILARTQQLITPVPVQEDDMTPDQIAGARIPTFNQDNTMTGQTATVAEYLGGLNLATQRNDAAFAEMQAKLDALSSRLDKLAASGGVTAAQLEAAAAAGARAALAALATALPKGA